MSKEAFTPVFDVAGVVTVSKSYTYYGEDSKTDPNKHDVNCKDMVVEACQLAKSKLGVNFSDYDLNHDGKADLVYLIYAGIGQNIGGAANTIWAHTGAGANYTIDNSTQIYSYGVNCELNTPDNKGTKITSLASAFSATNSLIVWEYQTCIHITPLRMSTTKNLNTGI